MTGCQSLPKRKTPCLDCVKRCVGCHTSCADYARYGAEQAACREKRYAVRGREMLSDGLKRSLNERDKARLQRRSQGKR